MEIFIRCSELTKRAQIGLSKIPYEQRFSFAKQSFDTVSYKLHSVFSKLLGDTTELHYIFCTVGLNLAVRIYLNPNIDFTDELEQCCFIVSPEDSHYLFKTFDDPDIKKCLKPNKRTGLYPIGVSRIEILYSETDVYKQVVRVEPVPVPNDIVPPEFENIESFRYFLKKIQLDIPEEYQEEMMGMINDQNHVFDEDSMNIDNPYFDNLQQRILQRLARCNNCKKFSVHTKLCGDCKRTRYCGKQCQKIHWKKIHKKECLK